MRENCMIKEFRDFPRWSKADALPGLLRTPWCARYGVKRGEVTCKTRRALMGKVSTWRGARMYERVPEPGSW